MSKKLLAGLAALTLVLGACSGDDDDTETTDTTVADDTGTDTADDADTGSDDDTDTDTGSDDSDTATDPGTDTDEVMSADDTSDIDSLCNAYFALIDGPSPDTASELLTLIEEPRPAGVELELSDIVSGASTETAATQGYVGPICGHDAAVNDHGDEGGFSDEESTLSTFQSVCLDLFDAWSLGDRVAATGLGDEAAIDTLFANPFSPPAGSGIRISDFGDCFYAIPDGVADVVIADSDVEAFVVDITWYPDDTFFDDPDRSARFEDAS